MNTRFFEIAGERKNTYTHTKAHSHTLIFVPQVKLVLWDVQVEQALVEVECGGAHRSWDLLVCGGGSRKVCDGGGDRRRVCGDEKGRMESGDADKVVLGGDAGKVVCDGDDKVVAGGDAGWLVGGGDDKVLAGGDEGRLVCGFLKDGLPYTFSTSLSDKLLPVIKVRRRDIFQPNDKY